MSNRNVSTRNVFAVWKCLHQLPPVVFKQCNACSKLPCVNIETHANMWLNYFARNDGNQILTKWNEVLRTSMCCEIKRLLRIVCIDDGCCALYVLLMVDTTCMRCRWLLVMLGITSLRNYLVVSCRMYFLWVSVAGCCPCWLLLLVVVAGCWVACCDVVGHCVSSNNCIVWSALLYGLHCCMSPYGIGCLCRMFVPYGWPLMFANVCIARRSYVSPIPTM